MMLDIPACTKLTKLMTMTRLTVCLELPQTNGV